MDPESTQNITEETEETEGAVTPQGDGGEEPQGTGTEDDKDYKALYEQTIKASRKWERLAKKNSNDEELNAVKAELDALKAANARRDLVTKVAADTGVSFEILTKMQGDDEEAIKANAALLAALKGEPAAPEPKHSRGVPDGGEQQADDMTAEDIMSIKNRAERIRQIAAHPHLFDNN